MSNEIFATKTADAKKTFDMG